MTKNVSETFIFNKDISKVNDVSHPEVNYHNMIREKSRLNRNKSPEIAGLPGIES